jgi:hypothetical protein
VLVDLVDLLEGDPAREPQRDGERPRASRGDLASPNPGTAAALDAPNHSSLTLADA